MDSRLSQAARLTLQTPFFWRIYLNYTLVVLICTLVLAAILIGSISRHELQEVADTLRERAELASVLALEPLRTLNYPQLRDRVDGLAARTGSRFTVIDPRGVVLADSHEDPYRMGNHLQRPEVQSAMAQGSGFGTRFSQTLQEDFAYFAVPLEREGERLGFMRAALPARAIASDIQDLQAAVMTYACLVAFVALLVGYYLAYRIAMPVGRIARLAQDIARGDFDRRLPVVDRAGLGRLSEAINELARNSAQRVTEITADRNRLAAIFAGMVEGVIDVDEQQKILHINEAAAGLLGLNPKHCLNRPIWEEIRVQEITRALDQAMGSRDVVKTQMRLSRESDELVVDIYAASLSTSAGRPIGAVIVLNDITELEKLERVRTDFVANASHELKTPITAIRALAETLLGDEQIDPETVRRFLERIHLQSMRLSQLISDLMALSRLESRESGMEFGPVNMGDVVRRAVQSVDQARESKKQKILLDLPADKVIVTGDYQNLSQLADNLVDNAVKYTPEKGEIRVGLKRQGEQVVLTVEDNGIGISPQYQQRVFERFYRVDKARSQSLGGTGLGLSIVKNIAEKHGGGVRLESQLGRGSRFIVTLPAEA